MHVDGESGKTVWFVCGGTCCCYCCRGSCCEIEASDRNDIYDSDVNDVDPFGDFLCAPRPRGHGAHKRDRAADSSSQIKRHFAEIGISAAVRGNRLMAQWITVSIWSTLVLFPRPSPSALFSRRIVSKYFNGSDCTPTAQQTLEKS